MKLLMDLVVNHTSDEHPWFVESRSSAGQPEARLVLVAPPRAGCEPGTPAPSRPTGGRSSPAPTWEYDEASGEYYLHLFSRKQPDLNWENPEVRRGGLRDDALVARPRRGRLPDGRHQHDLQGPGTARRARAPGSTAFGDGWRALPDGPRIHEFLAEMHREVFAGRTGQFLTVGEMPGVTVERGAAVHRPRARRGRHGLPVRARRRSTRARQVGRPRRSGCAT